MSSNSHDHLADALNAMMNGDHADDTAHAEAEHHEPPPAAQPPAAAPAPVRKAPAVPATPKPAARTPSPTPPPAPAAAPARPTRPTAPQPQASAPPQPKAPTPPAVQTQPAAPQRPARPSRPSAPTPAATPQPAAVPAAEAPVVDYAKRKSKPGKKSTMASLEYRRTLIPSCLVVGVMFPLLTIAFFLQPQTWALRHANLLIPVSIGIVGLLVLGVGVLNMLMVKKELEAQKAAASSTKT